MAIGVQESDVWAAADALLHAGEQPTIERVRLHLGRGSPNTVGPHLKAWFQTLGARLGGSVQAAPPAPDNVVAAAQQFWELALAAAKVEWQQAIADERHILTVAQDALAVDRESLRTEQKRLEQRETDLKAAIYSAREQAAAAHEHSRSLESQLSQSESRYMAAEVRLAESAEREHALQEKMAEAIAHHREALSAAEQRHASHERRWLTDLDAQRQATKKAQDELEHTRKDAAIQHAEQQRVQNEMTEARRSIEESLNAVRHELKTVTQRATTLDQMRATLEIELANDRISAASLQQQLQARVDELTQWTQEQGAQLHVKDDQLASQTHTLLQLQAQLIAIMAPTPQTPATNLPDDERRPDTTNTPTPSKET